MTTLAPTLSPTVNPVLEGFSDSVVIIFALVGLIYLTYGYRLMRPTLHIAGAVAGGGIAFAVAKATLHNNDWEVVCALAGALVLGASAGQIFELGLFLLGAGFGVAVALVANTSFLYLSRHTYPLWIVMGVLGLLFGVATVRSERPFVIASTSFCGAYGIVLCVGHWAGAFPPPFDVLHQHAGSGAASHADVAHAVPHAWYGYVGGWLVLALAGCALQSSVTGLTPEMRARRAHMRAVNSGAAYTRFP